MHRSELPLDDRPATVQHYHMHCSLFSLILAALPACMLAQAAPEAEATKGTSVAFGVHYGSPLRYSAAVGLIKDMSIHRNDGMIVMLEPGYQGSEISAGYFRQIGRLGTGYSLRAAAVRTGREPWNATPSTTYIGGEAHWMLILGVGGRLGYLRRVSNSTDHTRDNLASIGLSIGF
ncbi:MAG: hypothetical protein JWM95_4996 [Gemmatimonadetes bacterium]|nr:hypothetical protein [Gemmatimonadota bacterium]